MQSFDEMFLPKGTSLGEVIDKHKAAIAAIGAANAPFAFVRIQGKCFMAPDPDVRAAWERRRREANEVAPSTAEN